MCISGNWILAQALRTALAMGRAREARGRARRVGFEPPLPLAAGRDGGDTAELSVCPGVCVARLWTEAILQVSECPAGRNLGPDGRGRLSRLD